MIRKKKGRHRVATSLVLAGSLLVLILTLGPMAEHVSQGMLVSTESVRNATFGDVRCPRLPEPGGTVVRVSTVSELQDAVNSSAPNTTILVADGVYDLDGAYFRMDTPGLTLRSDSGSREAVVLDGNYVSTEIIQVVASDVTIADLTLREAFYHPIHVTSAPGIDVENTLIYNVHVVDAGEQAIKINPGAAGRYPDDGVVACSHIELTDAGRSHIRNDCYTGGVDAHQAQGWVIRDNVIQGFWCETGLSQHGVHLWRGSRDTVVERNVLRDNARGIGFGMATSGEARTYPDAPCPSALGGYVDHYDGIIRNNFSFVSQERLFASEYSFDCGICLWQACGADVLHNTVVSTRAPNSSSIEWRFGNTRADIINNLVSHNLLARDGDPIAFLAGNLSDATLSLFVDGAGGDLHLTGTADAAIDRGVSVAQSLCDDDIDGDARPLGAARDIGADEYRASSVSPVTDLRITRALTDSAALTATLEWSAPMGAITTALRYSRTLASEANWATASIIADALPGDTEVFTATVSFDGNTIYFASRSQSLNGVWSALSNNAFWPRKDVVIPLAMKNSP